MGRTDSARIAFVALVLMLSACSDKAPSICAQSKAKFFECSKEAASTSFDELYRLCEIGITTPEYGPMFKDCASAQTCEDFSGCFERHACQLVLTGPSETTFQLMCRLPESPASR